MSGYPPPGLVYPMQGSGYPPSTSGYPPTTSGYPPPIQAFAPVQTHPLQHNGVNVTQTYQTQVIQPVQPPTISTMGDIVHTEGPSTKAAVRNTFRSWGMSSVRCNCQHCSKEMNTKVSKYPKSSAWISCTILALSGFVLGCCLIPFCFSNCYESIHKCSNCGKEVGRRDTR